MKEVVVYIYIGDQFVPAGRLTFEQQGRYASASFQYGKHYLQRSDAITLDPVQLPLLSKEFITPPGFDIFNGIRDAGPDRWGRYLLDKKFAHPLDELDYITSIGSDRAGALAFSNQIEAINFQEPKRLDLKLCLDAAEQVMEGGEGPALDAYLNYGPSLGGARPKATVMWNNQPHVAKFTLSMDKRNEALIEYATMALAKHCGLNVPAIDKTRVSGRDIYLIERFDRKKDNRGERPISFISALTATGLHEQDFQDWSYLGLCDAINRLSPEPEHDKLELFKRMVFNVLVFNNDDHLRNHGFIYAGNQRWSLSPLYDVVPGLIHSETYMLALIIGDKGKEASLENARTAAKYFAIPEKQAEEMIQSIVKIVQTWEDHFHACGVEPEDIEKIRHSFDKRGNS
jgi:serine/threonine-protein kinase HipA